MLSNETYQRMLDDARSRAATRLGDAPTYSGGNEELRKSLYDQIANRKDFSYDINKDGLYNMYKDKYVQQGRMAMKDTMGQAAALTGGYGSSYGQAVGQQAYDRSLQTLNDVVPSLYGQAFSMYQDQGNRLKDQYGMANDLVNEDWTKYRAAVSDWQNNKQQAEALAQADAQAAMDIQQQNYANLYELILTTGYVPTDEELEAAGMTRDAAKALKKKAKKKNSTASYGGGGGGGGGSSSSTSNQNTDTSSTSTGMNLDDLVTGLGAFPILPQNYW